jgi:hypothetical protein
MSDEKRPDKTEFYFLTSIQLDRNERVVLECRLENNRITEQTAHRLQRHRKTNHVPTRLVNLEISPHQSPQSGLENPIEWHHHLKCRTTGHGLA